ncbi:type IV pilus biogenesis protein PilM [Massilia sp. BJB1822]|uniref:type IV pilus biogenesis protein PilM n=1 Tax=Massilia sp. BJB1822 TaxID=2744470 RepID=UPI001593DD4F|nr:type IV pilus biogenesis protein PilM [Massilia sp. BJB1822]NVE00139.1 type IV pilus biogenesis protein PilM [Massilia sp. BJB1822]
MLWLLFALGAVAGHAALSSRAEPARTVAARAEDLAQNMAVYRSAVVAYAAAHAGFSGTVADAKLALPSWYVRLPWWSNYVDGGMVTVYASSPPPLGFAAELQRVSRYSMLAGEARGGKLHTPAFGDTGIVLSTAVPNLAPVWLAPLN